MPTIRYLGPGRFTDHRRDFEALPGSDHDLPDDQAAAYLDHELFGDRWERVDTPDDAGSSTALDDGDSAAESEDQGGEDADAPLVDRDPEQLTETERRIDGADYQTLRQVAGRLNDVDGRGSEDELRVALHTDVDDDRVDEAFGAVEADED
jgi:hypothetical protein